MTALDTVEECLAGLDRVATQLTRLQAGVRRLVGDLELVEARIHQLTASVENRIDKSPRV